MNHQADADKATIMANMGFLNFWLSSTGGGGGGGAGGHPPEAVWPP